MLRRPPVTPSKLASTALLVLAVALGWLCLLGLCWLGWTMGFAA
jgi:hypothetical protein